jgi:two-component system, NtrC family, response regulator HydG
VTSSDLALARILLIENDPDAALYAAHVLGTRGGFEVTHAADAPTALRLAGERPWDLVLTDLELPGTTGLELIHALRRLQPAVPILVLTAQLITDSTAAALRGVASAVLEKPVRAGLLVETAAGLVTYPAGG